MKDDCPCGDCGEDTSTGQGGRKKPLLGGKEYIMPNHPVEKQPITFHGRARPGESEKRRGRNGFFSRRGSLILFIDIVVVAILATTLYPVFGRKDRDRSLDHRFTLGAEWSHDGIYYDLELKSPGKDEHLLPGELFTVRYGLRKSDSDEVLVMSEEILQEFPLTSGDIEEYRFFLPFDSGLLNGVDSLLALAWVETTEDTMLLRLELKKPN